MHGPSEVGLRESASPPVPDRSEGWEAMESTSTDWQTPRDDASDTPASGEVDLMKYYKRYYKGYQARVVAAQEDVLRLVSLGAVVLES